MGELGKEEEEVTEAWRKVPACRWFGIKAGVFEGSSDGNVKVLGEVREGTPDGDGYLRIEYHGRKFSKALLVILAWQGEPQVRHLGESNQDNRPAKLAWGSKRENERDKRENRREGKGEVSPPFQRLQPVTGDLLR